MISSGLADLILAASLIVSLVAYLLVARRERSFLHLMTPDYLVWIPASYILPAIYGHLFGTDASPFAFVYVYATMAVENLIFALVYLRPSKKVVALPFHFSYRNFTALAFLFLGLSFLVYAPILLEFPQYLLDPRQIYIQTRSGYGSSFFVSVALAYLSVIFVLFSGRSRWTKAAVIVGAMVVISLHGSKGAVVAVFFLVGLYEVYVRGIKVRLLPAMLAAVGMAVVLVGLFAATMSLQGSTLEALETIALYSDYTRNAMLVIDQKFPLQYGRLTLEGNVYAVIPRPLMPSKPKNFGALLLDEEFYPQIFDEDQGAPGFGVGVQYADFGVFAIVYLAVFAAFRGWLARIFVDRLSKTRHPADFVMVAFLGGVSLFNVGVGWMLPETVFVFLLVRYLSTWGPGPVYRERKPIDPPAANQLAVSEFDPA
jgi:hypothetical protein